MLPEFLKPYFWDCAFANLDPLRHQRFIAERILVFGNDTAIRWLRGNLPAKEWPELINSGKHLDPKTRNYWRLVLNHEPADKHSVCSKRTAFTQTGIDSMASALDIGLMKLEAISGRGDKKDFIDLYYILGHYSLSTLLEQHADKYGMDWTSRYHLLRSLVYFADAEDQPMPLMLQEVSWTKIKQTITEAVLLLNQGE